MKKIFILYLSVAMFMVGQCFAATATTEVLGGPAAVQSQGDIKNSPYYQALDFYHMNSQGSLELLPKFKTLQQNTEFTCGPAAALMVINYLRPELKVTEKELSVIMETGMGEIPNAALGTTTKGMVKYFTTKDWLVESSLTNKTPDTDEAFKRFIVEHLKKNTPIMVENVDWAGHWRVIIGYDDMGTALLNDDVLVMADPYDTTDHRQDGYNIVPAQRFFYMWFDHSLFPQEERDKQWLSVQAKRNLH